MPYGSGWKGIGGFFDAMAGGVDARIKNEMLRREQEQRQQSVNQEGERIGLSRRDLEFRQSEAEDEDALRKASMLQVGMMLPEDLRQKLDKRGIPYVVDPGTQTLLNPIQTGAAAQQYKLDERRTKADENQAGRYAGMQEIQLGQLHRQEQKDLSDSYVREQTSLQNYIAKTRPTVIMDPSAKRGLQEAETRLRGLNARYSILFKKAGFSDEEIAAFLPGLGQEAAPNPFTQAMGQWIQTQK